ncbi:MAG: hypothetical protein Q8L90_03320 [Bacteroidota bacterium]|nr:hypothetical protein [Bacteroidota bacterium]
MKNITSIDELRDSVFLLEIKQANDWCLLKEEFHTTYENLKPVNIIKNKFKDLAATPNLQSTVVNSVIGLATGFIAKKVFIGTSHNPITKILGIILEIAVANKVSKNADGIKSAGSSILKKIIN